MKGFFKRIVFLYLLLYLISCSTIRKQDNSNTNDLERKLIEKADRHFTDRKYMEGVTLLQNYLERFSVSEYSDDAVYRLAYVCVIADESNKYYNYKNAEMKFAEVIEKYPESNYIYACKNWIKILNLYNSVTGIQIKRNKFKQENKNYSVNDKLIKENVVLKSENDRLKKTLSELEKALQR